MEFGEPFEDGYEFLSFEEIRERNFVNVDAYLRIFLLLLFVILVVLLGEIMNLSRGLEYWFAFVLHKIILIAAITSGCTLFNGYKIFKYFLDKEFSILRAELVCSQNQIYICIAKLCCFIVGCFRLIMKRIHEFKPD